MGRAEDSIRGYRGIRWRCGGNQRCNNPFSGEFAYGWFRTETGVHRLVENLLSIRATEDTLLLPRYLSRLSSMMRSR